MHDIADTDTSEAGINGMVVRTPLSSNKEKDGKNQYMQRGSKHNNLAIYSSRKAWQTRGSLNEKNDRNCFKGRFSAARRYEHRYDKAIIRVSDF